MRKVPFPFSFLLVEGKPAVEKVLKAFQGRVGCSSVKPRGCQAVLYIRDTAWGRGWPGRQA